MSRNKERKASKASIVLFYILAFTWALPITLLGLLAIPYVKIFKKDKHKIRKIAGRYAITLTESSFGGVSLGIVYIVDGRNKLHTHCHELGHTVQLQWMGVLWIVLVAIPSFFRYHYRRYQHKRSPQRRLPTYDSIWFEAQATNLGYSHFYRDVVNASLDQ